MVTLKDEGSSTAGATFDDSLVGKLTENCRKTPSRMNKKPSGNSDDFEIFRPHGRISSDYLDLHVKKDFRPPYK
jgi:hypothetical protein